MKCRVFASLLPVGCGCLALLWSIAAVAADSPGDTVFFAPLDKLDDTAQTGQPLRYNGAVKFQTYEGVRCAYFDGTGNIEVNGDDGNLGDGPGTVTLWIYPEKYLGLMRALDIGGTDEKSKAKPISVCVQNGRLALRVGEVNIAGSMLCPERWTFVAVSCDGQKVTGYGNDQKIGEKALPVMFDPKSFCIGGAADTFGSPWRGYVANVCFYERALTPEEVSALAGQPGMMPVSSKIKTSDAPGLSYRDQAKKYAAMGIKVISTAGLVDDVGGSPVSKDELTVAERRAFHALDKLPKSFIKRSGLKDIIVLKSLSHKGNSVNGLCHGDYMFLVSGFGPETVYHELYHVFDPQEQSPAWKRLNATGFAYTGREETNKKKRRLERDQPFLYDFVSVYAMTNEREDRASTFAAMLAEGPGFLPRTRQSEVMKKKMEYIIGQTDRSGLLGKNFWKIHLGLP